MKKYYFLIIAVLLNLSVVFSQESLNNYAYVVVPDQFSFQKSPHQYQLNGLAKFLLKKNGVVAIGEYEDVPKQFKSLDCGGLYLKINKESSAFRTKLSFELKNCKNKTIYKSAIGSSSEKDFKKGYQESLRNAFKGINSRLDEIQAAFLNIKLKHLDAENDKRRFIASHYLNSIRNPKIKLPVYSGGKNHVFHVFTILTENRQALKEFR